MNSNNITFESLKVRLTQAIDDNVLKKGIIPPDSKGYVLIDGFTRINLQNELNSGVVFGGPSIPAVLIIGNSTGLIYTFAVKALLPDIQI